MHYNVLGHCIQTENSAKPRKQACGYLRDWILRHARLDSSLDYGCGKLRYSLELAHISRKLTLVDSEEQLRRCQLIEGNGTTIREYSRKAIPHSRVLSVAEFAEDRTRYDLIFCANVLPIIPSAKERSKVLEALRERLKQTGTCLFVCQYRNTYFSEMQNFEGAKAYLDGWVVIRQNGDSTYYGLLPRPKVESLAIHHGFQIVKSWIVGESAYVLCGKVSN